MAYGAAEHALAKEKLKRLKERGQQLIGGSIWDKVKGFVSNAASAVKSGIEKVGSTVKSAVSAAAGTAKNIVSEAASAVKSTVSVIADAAKAAVEKAGSTVKSAASAIANAAKTVVEKAEGAVKSAGSAIANAGRTVVEKIAGGVKAAGQALAEAGKKAGQFIQDHWKEIALTGLAIGGAVLTGGGSLLAGGLAGLAGLGASLISGIGGTIETTLMTWIVGAAEILAILGLFFELIPRLESLIINYAAKRGVKLE
jgi:hypothetical protein